MPNFERLLKMIDKEVGLQEKILKVLAKERTAIVKLNSEQIKIIQQEKEEVLDTAKKIETDRNNLIQSIGKELEFQDEKQKLKFSEIIKECKESKISSQLKKSANNLRDIAKTVKKMNDDNAVLIKQSLGLISSTLCIIQSSPEADLPTYSIKGKITASSDDPAFTSKRSIVRTA